MTTTIELSPEELALIEAKRAEKQAAADRRLLEDAARQAKIDRAHAEKARVIEVAIEALRAVDTDNLLFTPEGKDGLYFLLDGRAYQVVIEEHRVYNSNSWSGRATSNGMKYKLDNEYSNRYLKNPKTVIKKIVELQAEVVAKKARKVALNDLSVSATEKLVDMYPEAKVKFEKGHDYRRRGGRNNYSGNYQPDWVVVTTDKGVVHFTYSMSETGVMLTIFKTQQALTSTQIAESILGAPKS